MKNDWHNNKISKRLDEEYPHDFSICDIDGACRVFYKENNFYKNRLVIYESKELSEIITQTQLNTLFVLDHNIKWENFDEFSGLFIIRHDINIWNLKVMKIIEIVGYGRPLFDCQIVKEITLDDFYNWISATNKRNKEYFSIKPKINNELKLNL